MCGRGAWTWPCLAGPAPLARSSTSPPFWTTTDAPAAGWTGGRHCYCLCPPPSCTLSGAARRRLSFTILLLTIRPLFGCFLLLGCALSLYALIARYMRRAACPGFRTRGSFEHSNVAWYLSQMILATGIFVLSGNA